MNERWKSEFIGSHFPVDENWERWVRAWVQYYDRTEQIDRAYPHYPAKHGTDVIPWPPGMGRLTRREHAVAIRREMEHRRALTADMPPGLRMEVQEVAERIHSDTQVPCGCEPCRRHRGEV